MATISIADLKAADFTVDAPVLFDGSINGARLRAYVERALISTLEPGDIVIMDNLGSHKSHAVRAAIRKAGAHLFFLPPYTAGHKKWLIAGTTSRRKPRAASQAIHHGRKGPIGPYLRPLVLLARPQPHRDGLFQT